MPPMAAGIVGTIGPPGGVTGPRPVPALGGAAVPAALAVVGGGLLVTGGELTLPAAAAALPPTAAGVLPL
jgi:hypothetical protein